MRAMESEITCLTIVYSTVYSGADQRKHPNSASLAFVRGIHRWPVNSSHKGPVARKKFSSDDVIMVKCWPTCPPIQYGPESLYRFPLCRVWCGLALTKFTHVLLGYFISSGGVIRLFFVFSRFARLVLGQSCDYPSTSGTTLLNIG